MAEGKRRIKCVEVDCANMILPATAEANDGFCAPCADRRRAEERRKFIAANKRVVDPYAGITDLVELICAIHAPREHNPLIEYTAPPEPAGQLYAKLTRAEAERLMDIAVEALKSGNEHFADELATSLATLTDYNLDRLLRVFVQKNKFWPSIVFRNAGPEIRDSIIAALNSGRGHPNHALSALAWIGDELVRTQLEIWDSTSPEWWEHLYVLPSEYSHVAGWENFAGSRRDLFYNQCFAIETVSAGQPAERSAILAKETRGHCPWCDEKLIHLVEIDLADTRFSFLGVKAKTLPVLTCHICACYGVVFGEVTSDGAAHWAETNARPKFLPADTSTWAKIPWEGKPIALRKRRAIEAACQYDSPAASQIGGMPMWIQDDAYPECPCCKRTMMFLAQIDQSAFPGHEGIYYAFLCAQCRITATSYQQS
jgi:hypothetical protein